MVSERLLQPRSRSVLFLLCIILFTGAGFLLAHSYYFPAISLFIAGVILVWLIIKIYDATNEVVTFFFNSLRNDDTTIHFQTLKANKSLKSLYESMNLLNSHFQDIRLRNEYNETYYKTIIQNASTGLLVLNSNNKIELINKVACNYAGISSDSKNPDLLRIKHPAFYDAICNLKPGDNVTYRNLLSNNLQLLFFMATMIRRKDMDLKLVSIQDIRYELESRELESYRKLMNVMTHEIMNLLTPLTTVAKELYSLFCHNGRPGEVSGIDEATIKATVNGLMLIDEQSNGLLNFVNSYRKISKLPQPEFTTIYVSDWIEQLKIVFEGKMKESFVQFSINADKTLREIIADKKLLNQVIINLINNSYDAVMEIENDRKIGIQIMKTLYDRVLIKITNNGPLIPAQLQEKIFVPFFTTKKNGSGIGLSISQEIMKLHNGSLVVVSTEENKTSFIIEF
jgi:two-component system, NtrC family, nitrogen regulation sensor histidine kinase NtrY